jgi:hypothetical protein
MTHLTPYRVPLLLETTKVPKPACSAAKIRGRTAFVMEKLLIGCFGALLQQSVLEKIDRSTSEKIRSINFPGLPNFQAFPHEILPFLSYLPIKHKNTKTNKNIRK